MHEIEVIYKRPVFNEMPKIKHSRDADRIIRKAIEGVCLDYQEHFWCLYLNNANRVLGYCEISRGDATGTVVNIPQIFAIALRVSAKAIVVAHNHPSGNLKPSQSDKGILRRIETIAAMFGITLLDSLIITSESYFSFSDAGIILTPDNTLPF